MDKILYHLLHEKANEINLHLTISGDEITIIGAKPRQYTEILDVLCTAGYPIKSHYASCNSIGNIVDILTI